MLQNMELSMLYFLGGDKTEHQEFVSVSEVALAPPLSCSHSRGIHSYLLCPLSLLRARSRFLSQAVFLVALAPPLLSSSFAFVLLSLLVLTLHLRSRCILSKTRRSI